MGCYIRVTYINTKRIRNANKLRMRMKGIANRRNNLYCYANALVHLNIKGWKDTQVQIIKLVNKYISLESVPFSTVSHFGRFLTIFYLTPLKFTSL